MAQVLAAEIYAYLNQGKPIKEFRKPNKPDRNASDREWLDFALEQKLGQHLSSKYSRLLTYVHTLIVEAMDGAHTIERQHIISILENYTSNTSFNTIKRHIGVLVNEAITLGMQSNPLDGISTKRSKARLHRPFKDVASVLNEIEQFSRNLHLCCILTYGCLLRPHREVRELTWGDFAPDLSQLSLDGARVKSGRNRVVPVPDYIKPYLQQGIDSHNIFSHAKEPYNSHYFSTLWRRYAKQSRVIEQGQTIYSFRHSGAIEVYKRTQSVKFLQHVMGHASLEVSLVYLRGLDVPDIRAEDMPDLSL